MSFKLEYSEDSVIHMEALDKATISRIFRKIDDAVKNPRHFFKKLKGRPEYKLRVGDYRVIAEIDEHNQIIFIMSIGHRRDIYEKH